MSYLVDLSLTPEAFVEELNWKPRKLFILGSFLVTQLVPIATSSTIRIIRHWTNVVVVIKMLLTCAKHCHCTQCSHQSSLLNHCLICCHYASRASISFQLLKRLASASHVHFAVVCWISMPRWVNRPSWFSVSQTACSFLHFVKVRRPNEETQNIFLIFQFVHFFALFCCFFGQTARFLCRFAKISGLEI